LFTTSDEEWYAKFSLKSCPLICNILFLNGDCMKSSVLICIVFTIFKKKKKLLQKKTIGQKRAESSTGVVDHMQKK
jgi:thiamine transporter ThiT